MSKGPPGDVEILKHRRAIVKTRRPRGANGAAKSHRFVKFPDRLGFGRAGREQAGNVRRGSLGGVRRPEYQMASELRPYPDGALFRGW